MIKIAALVVLFLGPIVAFAQDAPTNDDVLQCARQIMSQHAWGFLPNQQSCSTAISVESAEVEDTSISGNVGQVRAHVQYRALMQFGGSSGLIQQCIGKSYQGNIMFSPGDPFGDENYVIAMQKWSSGWRCQ
jgi:hypothetical protein